MSKRTAAKRRRQSTPKAPTASVVLECEGACVRVDDVPMADAFTVLAQMLDAMRIAQEHYPEIRRPVRELQPVAGYSPLTTDDGDYEQGKRLGFTARRA